jgi:CO/xanthine dehydrogenase Mo-binding subunit
VTAGMSEAPEIPVIGAVANAIYDAIGIRMRSMLFPSDKILEALEGEEHKEQTINVT